jgi:hypothetical protein
MAKKPRPDPYEQGSLKLIYKWFIGPLIIYKPASYSIKEWLEEIFDLKNREIVRYVAKQTFTLPGLYYASAAHKIQGIGERRIRMGDVLWVRFDARNPGFVDVERTKKNDLEEDVFNLTIDEWKWTERHLEVKERDSAN